MFDGVGLKIYHACGKPSGFARRMQHDSAGFGCCWAINCSSSTMTSFSMKEPQPLPPFYPSRHVLWLVAAVSSENSLSWEAFCWVCP